MNETNLLYDLISLDPKQVRIKWYESTEHGYNLTVASSHKRCKCPVCNISTQDRQDLRVSSNKRPIKHLVLSSNKTIDLTIEKRYFRCKKCNCSFMEHFDFLAEKWETTKVFENYVIDAWWYMSWEQIARNANCSARKIRHILQTIDSEMINKQWLDIMKKLPEIRIGIDEHSFRGRDMILVITDIKAKKVLAILDDISKKTLQERMNKLPTDITTKMKWITTDMNKTYQQTVLEKLPTLQTTIDKYHLVQEANRMVDEVRQIEIRLAKSKFFNKADTLARGKISKQAARKLLLEEKK